MKKFLAILMALALVLSLAACGEKAAPTTESTTEATTESTTESTSEETSESTEEPAATINEEVASYLGNVENNVYVNEAAGCQQKSEDVAGTELRKNMNRSFKRL